MGPLAVIVFGAGLAVLTAALPAGVAALPSIGGAPPTIDAAFQRYWEARNPGDAWKAAQDVIRSGVSFEDAVARLKLGRLAVESRVAPSVATLLKWSARDDDRTMLFGAELHVPLRP